MDSRNKRTDNGAMPAAMMAFCNHTGHGITPAMTSASRHASQASCAAVTVTTPASSAQAAQASAMADLMVP